MLYRRVAEHLRAQNWLAVFLDLLIVVVGIYLGLQVNDWNERRLEDQQADATLERLRTDFGEILEEAESFLAEHQANADALDVLVRAITGEREDPDPEVIRFALKNALKYAPTSRRSSVWSELVSSGQTSLIRDAELRSLLAQYDEGHQTARFLFAQFWEGQRGHEVVFGRHFEYDSARKRIDDIILDGDIASWDLDAMASDPEFVYAAQRLLEYQSYYQFWHWRMHKDVREILDKLEDG